MGSVIRISLLMVISLGSLAIGYALLVTGLQTDHMYTDQVTKAAFVFVVGFVSLLILRLVVLSILALVQQVVYRRGLNQFIRAGGPVYQPRISIIVPAYNEELEIESALESHLALEYPHVEIVVVDDGSMDRTAELVQPFVHPDPEDGVYLHTIENSGKGDALNYGIEKSTGDLILCVDADSRLDSDALWYAVRHFQDPRVGAVAGNVKVINRRGLLPNLQGLEYIVGQNLLRRLQSMFNMVNIVPGPFGLFRRETLESVGGYDEDTFAEDCDLTLKILAAGWKIDYELNAIARTEAPEELGPFIRQRYRWTRGTLQSLIKHQRHLWGSGGMRMMAILWNMAFDAILWPIANLLCHICVFYLIWQIGLATYLVFWWIHFSCLDMSLALLCIASEREDARLAWHALVYRLLFIMMMDLCKFLASLEEFLNVKMHWGKLDRTGHEFTRSKEGEIFHAP